jgi:predicted RNA-binding protein with RPS1 domain
MPGFLHISQVRGYRIEDIQNEISEGQEVDVWVSKKEQDGSGKFAVTMVESNKMGQPQRRPPSDLTPFMNFDSSEWIPAKISGVQGFGAFAEATLPTGEVGSGLIHITQIAEGFVQDVSEHVQVGQEVKVRVVKVENGKLALSMKEEGGDRGFVEKEQVDYSPFAEVSADTWCKSTVKTITNFGAFVDVQLPGADTSANALLHISQMDTGGFIDSVEDHFSEGQEVDVRILSVDLDAGKMSVTMKKDDLDGEME